MRVRGVAAHFIFQPLPPGRLYLDCSLLAQLAAVPLRQKFLETVQILRVVGFAFGARLGVRWVPA